MNHQSESYSIKQNGRRPREDRIIIVLEWPLGRKDVIVHDHEVPEIRGEGKSSKDD